MIYIYIYYSYYVILSSSLGVEFKDIVMYDLIGFDAV
jgi:hypothetical protein